MKNNRTNRHFNYGGYYSEGHEWISNNSLYAISLKTSSLEKISYSMLVDRICKKIAIDETTRKLKMSYSLSKARKESYIVDDEDVYVLHVELLNDLEECQRVEQISRVEPRSSVGVNYEELDSNGRANDVENGGILTIFGGEMVEELNAAIIEETMEDAVWEHVSGNEFATMDNTMDNQEDDGLDGRHEYVELPSVVEESQRSQNVDEWEDGTGIKIGQEFFPKEAVQDLVNRAANKYSFATETIKSDPGRLMLRCRQVSKGCKWYLRIAKVKKSDCFTVRVHRKMHTCQRSDASTSNCKHTGTPRLIASVLHEDYPGQLNTPFPKNIMSIVRGRLGLHCSYSTAWREKKQHVSDVRGSPKKSYTMLYSYLYMLEKVNPGTVTSVELDAEKRFKYLFIAFGASIEGFKAMRKVVVVDATFLKTVYGGMLVFATAQDPNHHHYPIAFGVIDREKDASWSWFFKMLKTVIPDEPDLVFISDRHQNIIKAVCEVFPNAKHGHCVWHLYQNVRGKVKSDKDIAAAKFIECGHAYTEFEFNKEYGHFRKRFPKAGEYLDKCVDMDKWARCYFQGDKYNIDTSNAAESMNGVFDNARRYYLLPMIDAILEKIYEWFKSHRKDSAAALETRKLVPYVENVVHTLCPIAKLLPVTELNSFRREYSVIGLDGKTYLVDLIMKSCSCKCFDIDKYPCVHAIAAARNFLGKKARTSNIEMYELCSIYYLIDTWSLAYYITIYLVPHVSTWSIPDEIEELCIFPPECTKKPGINQETRFPSTGERRRKTRNKYQPGINLNKWLQPDIAPSVSNVG